GVGGAREVGVGRPRAAPGAAKGLGEFGGPLDGFDGLRGASASADGQQHGRAGAARAGGGAEELLRVGSVVGRAPGGDDVLTAADLVPVGVEPAVVVDGVLDGVRRGGWGGGWGCGPLLAVELERRGLAALVAGGRGGGCGHIVRPSRAKAPPIRRVVIVPLAGTGTKCALPRGDVEQTGLPNAYGLLAPSPSVAIRCAA